jgi:hypothetical protein
MRIVPPWTHCQRVRVMGQVVDASSASLTINGNPTPLARFQANRYWFNTEIMLLEGSNAIPFIVWDEFNNTRVDLLTLEYRRPARFAALTPHFSQSGLVGADPFPPTRLVARKTAVLSVNLEVLTADFRDTSVDRAELVLTAAGSTHVLDGKLAGWDGALITPPPEGIANGTAVYFIIDGSRLPPGTPVDLVLRLYACGSQVHQEPLANGWTFRETPPLTLVLQPQHRSLDATHTRALLSVLDHFARVYPVADGVAELDSAGPGGLRVHLMPPLSYRDHLDPDDTTPAGDYSQGFLLHDHRVGFGPGPDGIIGTNAMGISDDLSQSEFWLGEYLVMNFTFAEDANRNSTFDPLELTRVAAPPGGGPTPVFQRVQNWTTFAANGAENLRLSWNRERSFLSSRQAAHKCAVLTFRQNRNCETRGCLAGNAAAPWASHDPLGTPFLPHEITHTLGIRGDYTSACTIVGIAVDLLNRRQIPQPADLMCASVGGGPTNHFLRPTDYNILFDQFLPTGGRPGMESPRGGGEVDGQGASEFFVLVGSLTAGGSVDVSESFLTADVLPTAGTSDKTYTIAFLSALGELLAETALPVTFQTLHIDEPFERVPLSIVRAFPAGAVKVQIRKDGVPLAVWLRSPHAPNVLAVTASPYPNPDSTETVAVQWNATDDDGDPLTFSLSYAAGTNKPFVPIEGGLRTNKLLLATADVPGGAAARFKVVASDGFNTGEALSNPVSLQPAPPVAAILFPGDQAVLDPREEIQFRGAGLDAEDGALADAALNWYLLETTGPKWLGQGRRLAAPGLPPGTHRLRLVASDSDGLSGKAEMEFTVTAGGRPALAIRLLGGGLVELAWPTTAAGYVLETTDSLAPLIHWRPVTASTVEKQDRFTITDELPVESAFYRLRQP